jgi:hypothetical protein
MKNPFKIKDSNDIEHTALNIKVKQPYKRNTTEGLEYAMDEARNYTREWIEQRIAEQDKRKLPEPKKMTDQEFEEYYKKLLEYIKS